MSKAGGNRALSAAVNFLFGKRSWSALPAPQNDIDSINNTVVALKERIQVQSRERGSVLSSFTTVEDMINVGVIDPSGKTLEQRVTDIENRLAAASIP